MDPILPVNYLTRPNKNVERKLLFDLLAQLFVPMALCSYRYVGFGSVWFADFILAHKTLGIHDMVSIERRPERHKRAVFNCPFACVKVECGDSTSVLRSIFDGSTLKPCVAWLDYESSADETVLEDIRIIASGAPDRSVLLVTVNADHRNLAKEPGKREEAIRLCFGDLVPTFLPVDWDNMRGFPGLLGEILVNHAIHSTRVSGRKEHFHPIANIRYKDGAPMVTIGGIIQESAPSPLHALGTPQVQNHLQVPNLTIREKLALDQMLPCAGSVSEEDMGKKIGFSLGSEEFDAYRRYYQHYPVFHEIAI